MLADLEAGKKSAAGWDKKAKGGDKEAKRTLGSRGSCLGLTARGNRAACRGQEEEHKLFKSLGLLSAKPVLYVEQVEEAAAGRGNRFSNAVEDRAAEEGGGSVIVSAKIESEIAGFGRDERKEYLEVVGSGAWASVGSFARLWAFAA